MREYPKIQSVFKRDEKTHKFILEEYSLPEFEYLKDNVWVWTEKIDGTSLRAMWKIEESLLPSLDDKGRIEFGGKTDKAQIPEFLLDRLGTLFPSEKFKDIYPDKPMCLYGEGYGARIQKGGGNYIPDGVDFILFDVKIDEWWLKREDVEGIAKTLGIKAVPVVGEGTLDEAIKLLTGGLQSVVAQSHCLAEGLVLKPKVELQTRGGHRIVTKMKWKDF